MNKNKQIPNWLRVLPNGKYSLNFLVAFTKKSKPSLVRTFSNLKLQKEYQPMSQYPHLTEVFYIWENNIKNSIDKC